MTKPKQIAKSAYIQNDRLIVSTIYGDLFLSVQTPYLPTLRFAHSDCTKKVSEVIRELKAVNANKCEIKGFFCNNKQVFDINGVEYSNLEIDITICDGNIYSFYPSASYSNRYSSQNELTASASTKLDKALLDAIEPALKKYLNQFVNIQVSAAYQHINNQLKEYQNNINKTITHFNSLCK